MSGPRARSGAPDPVLRLIHGSMVMGVVLLGLVVRFVLPAAESPITDTWVWVSLVPAVAAAFAGGFMRGRITPAMSLGQRRTTAIAIWAFAEGAALCGLTFVLVTGAWVPAGLAALIGLALLLYHHPGTFA